MVVPEYQGKRIGTGIMNEILEQIDKYKNVNPFKFIKFMPSY